jgi:hypothetical protein
VSLALQILEAIRTSPAADVGRVGSSFEPPSRRG